MKLITNILNGIAKRILNKKPIQRFKNIPWLTERILKNEEDTSIKTRHFNTFKLSYIRPYEVVKTYKEIFNSEIYRFDCNTTSPIILDCGANIGMSCIYFKSIYPNATIIAFEPDEHLIEVLNKNITQNNFTNVTLHQAAVWIEDGFISFDSKGSEASHIDNSGSGTNLVKTIKLSNLLQAYDNIDFLKMDIEGAEFEVVKDCVPYLNKVSNFFLEYHGKVSDTNKLQILIKILEQANFKVYIKNAADSLKSPFVQKTTGEMYDVQLNIFCYK